MKKDVLFYKFNSCKKTLLVILLTIFGYATTFAQTRQITGKVTSADDGGGLPGVSVRIKGTTTGVQTDVNGAFKISASTGTVLTFSYVGYLPQQIIVGDASVYNIKLSPDAQTLTEVNVVSIGYGTAKRKDLTGSISSISAKQIEELPVTSLDQALQGRAAGVQVTSNDGSPGGNITVLIRGTGSLATGGNVPLYVIDGYPLEAGGINNINPNDIASIDVLKDASATAIYGIRAANGVVLVTTKKGKTNGVTVSLDGYEAFQGKPKEYDVLNAQQFATLANQVAAGSNGNFQSFSGWATPSSLTNVDWQNAVYRAGLTQNYSLAIRGGNDKINTSTSLGYYDQKGIVLGSYFKRVTVGSNLEYKPQKWLKSNSFVKYTYQDQNNPYGTGSLIGLSELPPTLDGGNQLTNQIKDRNGNYGFFNPIYVYVAKYNNPVYTIENNRYANIGNFFVANTNLEATIIDGLKVKSNAGITYNGYSGSYFSPEDDRIVNQYGAQAGATQNATYSQNINSSFDWLFENTISYDKTFGKHTINFVGGVSEQELTYNSMAGSGIPPNSVIRDLSQSKTPVFTAGQNGQVIQSLASQFVRLGYNYADRYFITGTVRRDGSSKFAPGHQYGTFPSGAVSWKAKQESFLKNVDWLSDLKFRGSYGEVGNEITINPFQYQALYAAGSAANTAPNYGYTFNKTFQGGIYSTQPANDNLRWETDTQADLGTDISFLHGDLTLTVDLFDRKSKDFLLNLAASPQTGYSFITHNIGSMENKGIEIALNYSHAVNKDFHYGANLTITSIANKLTSITSGIKEVSNFGGLSIPADGWGTFTETNVGQPVGEFYGYKSLGIFQSQAQIDALNANAVSHGFSAYQKTITQPGDRYFADVNGDGTVNASDQVSLGSPIPKFYGGLNLDATYKSWDVGLYFYGVYGNKIFNFAESALESFQNRSFVGVENISKTYLQNAWTTSNPSNTYARITSNDDAIGSNVASSAYIENGSFLKLKTLTIGYSIAPDFLKKIAITKLRFYASTQNLFTITSYKGLDPEIGIQGANPTQNGVDNGTYPSSKYYTVGINVTF
ncbi:SusC/RagA family TonB-linked outer membrane protein [Mucilaginibacter gotjawali]|uniref:TonB-linked SusC/RagA family outer membrane protein n=2 Tax=Mucilaginibacter gotjawali TaxID=1550579 RepID=A0A839SJ80_9SPHI|nr:TonB-dependent receptor [Mucilaginibacter gotjawali]MBB3058391.1 TonB-linked SusC/RagA family outer membrane protein [Mucilaginibacter gotjawali]BAU53781.1 TonB-dependent Receptor Plug Domain protein [Mucilaginibacter gotjawali]